MRAIIKNNMPFCPKCDIILKTESTDYFLVQDENDESYFEFTRRCNKCGKLFKYYVDTQFDIRYDLKDTQIKKITS